MCNDTKLYYCLQNCRFPRICGTHLNAVFMYFIEAHRKVPQERQLSIFLGWMTSLRHPHQSELLGRQVTLSVWHPSELLLNTIFNSPTGQPMFLHGSERPLSPCGSHQRKQHRNILRMEFICQSSIWRTSNKEYGRFIKISTAQQAQNMFDHVTKRAEEHGMVVNDAKTGLMCISTSINFESRAVTKGRNGEEIMSRGCLKFLGFQLDSYCSIRTHVESLRKKLRSRTWALLRLRRAGMTKEELTRVARLLSDLLLNMPVLHGIPCWLRSRLGKVKNSNFKH